MCIGGKNMSIQSNSSIEITEDGRIYNDSLSVWDVNSFIIKVAFADDFAVDVSKFKEKYIKMKKGMVQPSKPNIVISFGILVTDKNFTLVNILSDMEWENVLEFLKNKLQMSSLSGCGRITYNQLI